MTGEALASIQTVTSPSGTPMVKWRRRSMFKRLDPPRDITLLAHKIMITEHPSRLDMDLLARWVLGLELEMSERPESLEEQASQEGYVPEYEPDEEPDDWFPWDEPDEDFTVYEVEAGPKPRKWTVVDSFGFYHTVEADYIGHSSKGYITFWNKTGSTVNNLVAAFYQPASVYEEGMEE
jgi:hypothetical protein